MLVNVFSLSQSSNFFGNRANIIKAITAYYNSNFLVNVRKTLGNIEWEDYLKYLLISVIITRDISNKSLKI